MLGEEEAPRQRKLGGRGKTKQKMLVSGAKKVEYWRRIQGCRKDAREETWGWRDISAQKCSWVARKGGLKEKSGC